jgi:hypothetical protein
MKNVDYSESNDFFPTYAPWNSCLFETSVILTVWEHADQLVGDNNVAILHTDIKINRKSGETWRTINKSLQAGKSVGLAAPAAYFGVWKDWHIPDSAPCTPKYDPFYRHYFDNKIHVWDFIKCYDREIHDWAMDTQPRLIYSHQFACTRETFDYLGERLYGIAHRMRLQDIGFWTPHMFERLIALYLAKRGPIELTTAFWHYASSGIAGPGKQSLYGPRPLMYYKIRNRISERSPE